MRKAEVLTALGLIAFSVAVIFQARQVGIGVPGEEFRPGFFPFWLALLMGVFSLLILVRYVRSALQEGPLPPFFHDRVDAGSVAKVAVTAALMLALIPLVGFYTAGIAYMFVYLRFVGRHRWPAVIILSAGIPIGAYFVFEQILQILLPRGMFSLIPFLD